MAARQPSPPQAVTAAVLDLLKSAGLAGAAETPAVRELSGGVSSEIWRVDLASGPVCVKRALPRLRVAQVWEAPVERNGFEEAWLRLAGEIVPGCAPRILARGDGLFAMEYLDAPVWKERLKAGDADARFAGSVGRTLAAIHRATTGRAEVRAAFATDTIFHAIRLEPYLVATAQKHPQLAQRLQGLVERTAQTKECLVHGDVSPKNILVRDSGPVFLDAECAWYGDPAFDLAFCLNHLLLKCLWVPSSKENFLGCFDALIAAYAPGKDLEERTAALLPALFLARVDGKSPVEYLDEAGRNTVRRIAWPLVALPPSSLQQVRDAWQK
jgi:aminoglycoside phosphotransferase (APT) family kinase protein